MKTVENKTAETILQTPIKIEVGGRTFNVARPTTATLIEVSKLISLLPAVRLEEKNFIYESLSIAKDCSIIGQIAATLILGISKETHLPFEKESGIKWLKLRSTKNRYKELARDILLTLSPQELEEVIVEILKGMEIKSFFQVTTSLLEVNLLRATR